LNRQEADAVMNDFQAGYNFELPAELIAQEPAQAREQSRLLLVEPGRGVVGEEPFHAIEGLLRPGDLLVLNQSRVLPARLLARREDTAGRVEILLVRPAGDGCWLAMARPARRLRPGQRLLLQAPHRGEAGPDAGLEIVRRRDDGHVLVRGSEDLGLLAERWGLMPLPPYIKQDVTGDGAVRQDERDRARYQTVYAVPDGDGAASVAAPTAGLHFTLPLLERLQAAGVKLARLTLHVGPGTFRPPSPEQIAARRLHREAFHLPAEVTAAIADTRRQGGRVIAVGTTSLRVLETVARLDLDRDGPSLRRFGDHAGDPDSVFAGQAERREPGWEVSGQTRLFLRPPDRITAADGLLTNFHLPGSSLLMLVAALMGEETWPEVYGHAVRRRMRFYSYGDCMLILPRLGERHD
jgi:S-adenosylmethionine:tRNA ribosyltransferase-isomerase